MISMSRQNPKTIYACMWDFRRQGWTFRSRRPGQRHSFKSTDGGEHWTELTDSNARACRRNRGAASPWLSLLQSRRSSTRSSKSAKSALYRSDDGGTTWTRAGRSQNMIWRPFYFANLIVDPKDENKVYKAGRIAAAQQSTAARASATSRAARTATFTMSGSIPNNTDIVITGDDGGLWFQYDGGNRWWKAENLPVSQFYHVSVDNAMPYHVYGGLQDNSSWVGDSSYPGGITKHRWENMYGGDGFWMFADPSDPDYIYAESQGGEIGRVNRKTHETRSIKPLPQLQREESCASTGTRRFT